MSEITISSKFQIVIPKEIREQLGLSPGNRLRAICVGNRIELLPVIDLKSARGFLKGLDTAVEREDDRV